METPLVGPSLSVQCKNASVAVQLIPSQHSSPDSVDLSSPYLDRDILEHITVLPCLPSPGRAASTDLVNRSKDESPLPVLREISTDVARTKCPRPRVDHALNVYDSSEDGEGGDDDDLWHTPPLARTLSGTPLQSATFTSNRLFLSPVKPTDFPAIGTLRLAGIASPIAKSNSISPSLVKVKNAVDERKKDREKRDKDQSQISTQSVTLSSRRMLRTRLAMSRLRPPCPSNCLPGLPIPEISRALHRSSSHETNYASC